ncbi:MAG: ABC transporter substrate-binding protein [Pyrinomonadaceae bacterium]
MLSRRFIALLFILACTAFSFSCKGGSGGGGQSGPFVTVLDANPATLDPLDGTDASSSRLEQLMFNSLLKKNEKFEYVGDLASDYKVSDDAKTVTFTLHDGVTFHDGRPLTSADAKYTLDSLLASTKKKAPPFFESASAAGQQSASSGTQPYVTSVEAPDARTLVIHLRKPWSQLLGNLVSVPVIPQGSADTQKQNPVGSGPFRFVRYDESQQIVDLQAYDKYWQGAPAIKDLRVRAILDANTLQAELQSGRIDLVSGAANLSSDYYKLLAQDPQLKVDSFPGANIVYLGFNCEQAPLNNVKVRQAISYAVDREAIVRDLLLGQARLAHSILPEASWAYDAGQKYSYDPAHAKALLDEAGFTDPDGDGPQMRFGNKPLVFKISAGNSAVSQYAGVIQNSLKSIGVPVQIESLETNTLLPQLNLGQFQMTTLRWIGGNQDPSFLRDLFHSNEIPTPARNNTRNRGRYRNSELDRILDEAVNTTDREKARALYVQAQGIISRDVPLLPLWYPDVVAISRRNVGNIKIDASNDFSFLRNVTVESK